MLGLTQNPRPSLFDQPFGPRALLGQEQELAPVGQVPAHPIDQGTDAVGTEDIVATGTRMPRMSPEELGMPGLSTMRTPDQESVTDLRAALQDKAKMARDLYHKGSEFGTNGLLRDVIGNAMDFGRRLLGFDPRYNDQKWTERAYGMTSSNPAVAAAAREQAMQYNPTKTMAYAKALDSEAAQRVSSGTTAEYRNSQAAARQATILGGLGSAVLKANLGADPELAEINYQRMLPAIQKNLDAVYGEGVVQAPANYDEGFIRGLTQTGMTGSNIVSGQNAVLSSATRREIANGRNMTSIEVARIGADARRYAADANYRATVNRLAVQAQPIETITETEQTGSIVRPGKREVKTIVRAAGQGGGVAPSNGPAVGYVNKNGMRFNGGDWRDLNNWTKVR